MATIDCDGRRVELAPGEKVLDGLLRAGVAIAHACRAGACQSCLVRATRGVVPPEAQVGLKETLRLQGYFLACAAAPREDIEVTLRGTDGLQVPATITSIEPLGRDVARVRMAPARPLPYRPGQFINVVRADGLARSYSLASVPEEDGDALELHVRALPDGRMSRWLSDAANVGVGVAVRGPSGGCFYVAGDLQRPLLLAGAGTGLAPLLGLLRDALRLGHTGPISLFHGARVPSGLYLVNELRALQRRHANVSYVPCALEGDPSDEIARGPLDEIALGPVPSLSGFRVYLCGDPDLVGRMRRKAFLAGAALADIHADAFLTAPPSPSQG